MGIPSPAVIPAKAGITKHPSSSATRRDGVPRKAASGTAEVRLTLLLRSPEGDGDPQPRRHSCEGRNHEAPKLIRDSARRRTDEGRQRNGRGTANPLAVVNRRSWISQPRRHSCEGRNHEAPRLIRDSAQRRTNEGCERNGRGTANPLAAVTRRGSGFLPAQE